MHIFDRMDKGQSYQQPLRNALYYTQSLLAVYSLVSEK